MKMRGQIYILIAAMIVIAVAALADIGFYNSLPVQREQTSLGSSGAVMQNINTEITYVMENNATNLDDFVNFTVEYASEKNLNMTVESEEH